jgi:hypothetical protein
MKESWVCQLIPDFQKNEKIKRVTFYFITYYSSEYEVTVVHIAILSTFGTPEQTLIRILKVEKSVYGNVTSTTAC